MMVLKTEDGSKDNISVKSRKSLYRPRSREPTDLAVAQDAAEAQEDQGKLCFVCGLEFEDHALDFNIDLFHYHNLLHECFMDRSMSRSPSANHTPKAVLAAAPGLSSGGHSEREANLFSQLRVNLLQKQQFQQREDAEDEPSPEFINRTGNHDSQYRK